MRPLRRNPEGRGFPGDLLCRAARPWGLPWASRRFVHLIPESRRRDHAGLIQRFLRTYAGRAAFPTADKWRTAPPTSPRWLRTLLGRVGALHRPAPVFVAGPVEGGELGLHREAGPACRTHDLEPDAVRGELVRRRHEGMRALVKEDEVVHLRRQRLELRFVPDDAVSRTGGFGDGDAPAHDDRMIGRRSNFGNRAAAGGASRRRAVSKGERGRVAHRDQRCCAEQQRATSPAAWRRDGKKHQSGGGTNPFLPTVSRSAASVPSGCAAAYTTTCAPGTSTDRSAGSTITMGTFTGTTTTFSPPL